MLTCLSPTGSKFQMGEFHLDLGGNRAFRMIPNWSISKTADLTPSLLVRVRAHQRGGTDHSLGESLFPPEE